MGRVKIRNAEWSQRIKYGMVLRNDIWGMTYKTRNAELSQKYTFTNRARLSQDVSTPIEPGVAWRAASRWIIQRVVF